MRIPPLEFLQYEQRVAVDVTTVSQDWDTAVLDAQSRKVRTGHGDRLDALVIRDTAESEVVYDFAGPWRHGPEEEDWLIGCVHYAWS